MKTNKGALIVNVIAAALACVGIIAYLINCQTGYFTVYGINTAAVIMVIAAIVLLLGGIVLSMKKASLPSDLMAIAAPVLLVIGTFLIIGARINGIAAVMTYDNNASTMADMTSAIVAIVCLLIATVVATVASFQDIAKA